MFVTGNIKSKISYVLQQRIEFERNREFFSEMDKKLFGDDCETPWKQVYNITVPSAALSFLDGGALWQEGRGNFPRAKSWLIKKDRPGALGTKTCKQNRQKCLVIKKKSLREKKLNADKCVTLLKIWMLLLFVDASYLFL